MIYLEIQKMSEYVERERQLVLLSKNVIFVLKIVNWGIAIKILCLTGLVHIALVVTDTRVS